jgi:hypothetical protein
LATVHLLQEFRLNLLGFPVGPLGLSRDLAADPAFAAGERIATGVDLHLQAVTALRITAASLAGQSAVTEEE